MSVHANCLVTVLARRCVCTSPLDLSLVPVTVHRIQKESVSRALSEPSVFHICTVQRRRHVSGWCSCMQTRVYGCLQDSTVHQLSNHKLPHNPHYTYDEICFSWCVLNAPAVLFLLWRGMLTTPCSNALSAADGACECVSLGRNIQTS